MRLIKAGVLMIGIFLFLPSIIQASDLNAWLNAPNGIPNGDSWYYLGNDNEAKFIKLIYIQGFLDASAYITINQKIDIESVDSINLILQNTCKIPQSIYMRYQAGGTVGMYGEGLDSLYADYKNRKISINDAIHVVKKQSTGTQPEDIEHILLYLRGGKSDYELLQIRDQNNKVIRSVSFP